MKSGPWSGGVWSVAGGKREPFIPLLVIAVPLAVWPLLPLEMNIGPSPGTSQAVLRASDVAAERADLTIATTPEVVLDGGTNPFVTVVGAVMVGDTIVIADGQTGLLHIYLTSGELLGLVGGPGQGPGEFVTLNWIQEVGRHFVAYDRDPRRLSEFTLQGEFIGSVTIRAPDRFMFPTAVGVFEDRSILVATTGMSPRDGVWRSRRALVRHDEDGSYLDSLTAFEGTESYTEPWGRAGQISGPLPFGKQSAVTTRGMAFYVAENSDDRTAVFDASGKLTRELRLPEIPEPRAVTSDDIAAVREWGVATGVTKEALAVFDRMPFPPTFSTYGWYIPHSSRRLTMLRVDRGGNVWVLHAGGGRDTQPQWTVFGPDGVVKARIKAPEVMDVLASTEEIVVVRHWDEFDVETVQIRRLLP